MVRNDYALLANRASLGAKIEARFPIILNGKRGLAAIGRGFLGEGTPVKFAQICDPKRIQLKLCLLAAAAVFALPAAAKAADAAAGEKAYAKTCKECHNMPTEGGEGPKLIPLEHTGDEIRDIVRFGNGEMKALATTSITDADLDNVIAYLESVDKKGK